MNLATLGINIDPNPAVAAAAQVRAALASVANAAKDMATQVQAANKQAGATPTTPAQQQQLSWWDKMRQQLSQWVGGTKQAGTATQAMAQQSTQAMGGMLAQGNGLVGVFYKLGTVIAGISFVAMLGWLAKVGVQFDSLLEDAVTGIAAVQRTFRPDLYQDFDMAVTASAQAVDTLKKKAAESPATFEALVGAFQATAGAAGKANIGMQEHINLIVMMSQALKGLGISDQQIITESRSLFTGNINAESDAAKMLGITSEDIHQATAAGQLADFLTDKMKAFGEAGKVAALNASTSFSNIKDNFQQLAGEVSKPLFDVLKASALQFLDVFQGDAGRTALKGFATDLGAFAAAATSMLTYLAQNASALLTAAKYLGIYWVAMKAIQLGDFIRGVLASALALQTQTTALEANAAATTRANNAKRLLAGVAVAGAFAAGGGTGTAIGAGLGSLLGPYGTIIGAATGLMYDKLSEGQKNMNAAVAAGLKLAQDQMAAMQQQVGVAETLVAKGKARAEIEAHIAEIQAAMPAALAAADAHPTTASFLGGDEDSAETKRVDDLRKQLAFYKGQNVDANFGAYAADTKAGIDYEKAFNFQIDALRKEIDAATTLQAKTQARLDLDKQIADVNAKIASATEPAGSPGGGLKDAMIGAKQALDGVASNFDKIVGSGAMAKKQQDDINERLKVANRELGDTLDMSKAKLDGDAAEIDRLNDKKRINDLLKSLDTDIKNAKADQLRYVQQIVDNETKLAEIEAQRTLAETARAQRMSGIDKTPQIASLEAQGRTNEAQQLQTQMLNERLAESKKQLAEVQAEQSAALARAGVYDVPSNLSNADFGPGGQLDISNAANGIMSNVDGVKLLIPAAKAIGDATAAIAQAMKDVADNSKKMLDQVPTDAHTMQALGQTIQNMQTSYQNGGMTMTEFQRRTDAARDQAAGDLSNPAQYRDQLGAYRAMQAEKLKVEQETDAKITAGGATMTEGLTRGFQKAQESFGNMGTQMVKLAQDITTQISDGIAGALTDIATGAKSAGDAFRDMAITILNGIAKMIINMLVQLAIAQALAALGYGGGGTVAGAVRPSAIAIPTGGSARGGYTYASGGNVYGGNGGIDDIPAMLTAGEYVIKKSSVDRYGTSFFDALNSGRIGKHADGGAIAGAQAGRSLGVGSTGATAGGGAVNIAVSVDARGDNKDPEKEKDRADKITRDLKRAMDAWAIDARRPGGVLNNSNS